ncbi:hypothetical protein ACN9M0_39460 [Streptomyces sp. R-07]|uniref:hypothetical protein n=1 Tax=unclassified Streptomyces TaxID=2593676 RepID=UPI0037CCC70B
MPFTRTAVGCAAAALLLTGLSAGTAQANVGNVLIQQYDAAGNTVCTQDLLDLNPLAPYSVTDPICPNVVSERITNLTVEPITDTVGTTTTTIPAGQSVLVADISYNAITQVVDFSVPPLAQP